MPSFLDLLYLLVILYCVIAFLQVILAVEPPLIVTFIVCFLQIYHTDNKYKPLNLETLLNTWTKSRLEEVVTHDAHDQGTGLVLNLISEISEVVCSQLHSGIMKTARKVLLDEIVSCIISDSLVMKKTHKNHKIIPVIESAKSFSSYGRAVGTHTSKEFDHNTYGPC